MKLRAELASFVHQILSWRIAVGVLLLLTLSVYIFSILHGWLYVGDGDRSSRFLHALEYAENPAKAFRLEAWLYNWPPVPFMIQGALLRIILYPTMPDIIAGVKAIHVMSVTVTLTSFYILSRSVAMQTDEFGGFLAGSLPLLCSIPLRLAHTTSALIYGLFFVSFGIYFMFRVICFNSNVLWCVVAFVLAFFCRHEAIVVAWWASCFLLIHEKLKPSIILLSLATVVPLLKLILAVYLLEDTKFFEIGNLYVYPATLYHNLGRIYRLVIYFVTNDLMLIIALCMLILIALSAYFDGLKTSLKNAMTNFRTERSMLFRNAKVKIIYCFRRLKTYIKHNAYMFWAISFMISIGILIIELLRGNIPFHMRYLTNAEVFFAAMVATVGVYSLRTAGGSNSRLSGTAVRAILAVLVLASVWSGVLHASGRRAAWEMSRSMADVIEFIRSSRLQGDKVAFDFLRYKAKAIEIYTLDPRVETPNQFVNLKDFPQIRALMPEGINNSGHSSESRGVEGTALLHAYIHSTCPRYLVLASESLFESMRRMEPRLALSGRRIDYIRGYMRIQGDQFVFRSPYVLPGAKVAYRQVFTTEEFVVVERENEGGDVCIPFGRRKK